MALRILHTADWHLGQSFHNYDRTYEHRQFLAWLLTVIAERRPDALLVSGDIFDTINPSAIAQHLLYDFLARAHTINSALQIILTAGNHDAAARLESTNPVLRNLNIHIIGTVPRDNADGRPDYSRLTIPICNEKGNTEALCLAVPFLRLSDFPPSTGATGETDAYLEGIRDFYAAATNHAAAMRGRDFPGAALIAMGHCHMQDAQATPDSERRIVVGGAESLSPAIFPPPLAYVALGHLHLPQSLDGGRARYSGSPIPLSFTEKNYPHQVIELGIEDGKVAETVVHRIPRTVPLLRIPERGALPLEELLATLATYPFPNDTAENVPYLEVHVQDGGPDPQRRHRIEQALAGKPVRLCTLRLDPVEPSDATAAPDPNVAPAVALADLATIDPEKILSQAYEQRYATAPDAPLLAAFNEILSTLNS